MLLLCSTTTRRGSSFSEARYAESVVPAVIVRESPLTVNAMVDGSCTSGVVIRRKIVAGGSFGLRGVPDAPDHGEPIRTRLAKHRAVLRPHAADRDDRDLHCRGQRAHERQSASLLAGMRRGREHVS